MHVVHLDTKIRKKEFRRRRGCSRKRFFSLYPLLLPMPPSLFLSLTNRQIVSRFRWEWKFGTINSNGAYVLGDLLLGSLLAPPPHPSFADWNPFFSRLNLMVTLVVLFIGCVPSLRRRATTATAHSSSSPATPFPHALLYPRFYHNSDKFVHDDITVDRSVKRRAFYIFAEATLRAQ